MTVQTSQHSSRAVAEPTMTAREINTLEMGIPFSIRDNALAHEPKIRVELAEIVPRVTVTPVSAANGVDILLDRKLPGELAWDWKPVIGLTYRNDYRGAILTPDEFLSAHMSYQLCSLSARTPELTGRRIFVMTHVLSNRNLERTVGWTVLERIRLN